MEKLYPIMFAVTAAAITMAVVLFGTSENGETAKATLESQEIAPVAPVEVVALPAEPAAPSEPEPVVVEMKTVTESVCNIENGRKRCRFVSKEVPVTPES